MIVLPEVERGRVGKRGMEKGLFSKSQGGIHLLEM